MNESAETLLLAGEARSTINGCTSKVAPVRERPQTISFPKGVSAKPANLKC